MKKGVLIFFIFVSISIFSCFLQRDYKVYPKIKDLKKLLRKIYELVNKKDYKGLRYYIYSVNYKKDNLKFNSYEFLIDNFKKAKESKNGSLFYSNFGIYYHANFVRSEMTKRGDKNLVDKYLLKTSILESDKKLKKIYEQSLESFYVYENEFTSLVFVEDNDELKILFIYNLGILSSEPRLDFSKASWE